MRTIDRGIIQYQMGRLEDEIRKVKAALKNQKHESGITYWEDILKHFENKMKIYKKQLLDSNGAYDQ